MADWPLPIEGGSLADEGTATASSSATTLTASGSANTKGSWAQLVASTPYDAGALLVSVRTLSATQMDALVDIGIGGSGSEQVVIPNLAVASGSAAISHIGALLFPIAIPAGTRIAGRMQGATGSITARAQVTLIAGGWGFAEQALQRVTAYGADTATSRGTLVDPGGSANTKGSWSELTAATTAPIRQLWVLLGTGDAVKTSNWLIDIGIGGSGSEQVIVPNLFCVGNSSDNCMSPMSFGPLPIAIPAGTRIAMRAQSITTTAGQRAFDAVVYGAG